MKNNTLLDRTFCFGVNILKFLNKLPYNQVYKAPILQRYRSSTSVGANYEEAQGGAITKKISVTNWSFVQRS